MDQKILTHMDRTFLADMHRMTTQAQTVQMLHFDGLEVFMIGALLLTLICVSAMLVCVRPSLSPPGPRLYPLLGNLNLLYHYDLLELVDKMRLLYGDIFSLYLGPRPVVFICGPRLIREAFHKNGKDFCHRPPLRCGDKRKKGLRHTSGDFWRSQRSLVSWAFRELGENAIESNMAVDLVALASTLIDTQGMPFDPSEVIHATGVNVLLQICLGLRLERGDPQLDTLMESLREIGSTSVKASLLQLLPIPRWSRWEPFKLGNVRRAESTLREIVEGHVSARLERMSQAPKCLTDFYLRKLRHNADTGANQDLDAETICQVMTELIMSGSEAITSTFLWLLFYLAMHPDIQDELYLELDSTLMGNFPSYKDIAELPYLEAVLCEVQRLGDITPVIQWRSTVNTTVLDGFQIPSGSIIVPCLTTVMHDPRIFHDPEVFQPDRFMGARRTRIVETGFAPFFMGERSCVGETPARMALVLLTIAMLQHFRFRFPEGFTPQTVNGVTGRTRRPLPFQLEIVHRQ